MTPTLSPRMLISRPGHPAADSMGLVSVSVSRDLTTDEVQAHASGFARLWLSASEVREATELLRMRVEWMAECEARSEARNG